jgi:hypothetical protein
MDGKGRCMDNIFVERLWRSLKYEEVYLNAYATVAEAKAGIGTWLSFYNNERQHQSLGYRTPQQIYEESLWICGRSASPTGCASPASRASSESGEMLAFAHIPTGTTANKGFNIDDEVNGRLVEPAVARTAIGAEIKTGRATPYDMAPAVARSGSTSVFRASEPRSRFRRPREAGVQSLLLA